MIRYKRPKPPPDWETRVAHARDYICRIVEGGDIPKEDDFETLWKDDVKPRFQAAQHRKCGYCEQKLTDTGAIDHYAPKGQVCTLLDDPATWGHEIRNTNIVRERKNPRISGCEVGYWWRAYDWNNYILACERCNTGWKRDLFPIREARCQPMPRTRAAAEMWKETPLLLNPFDSDEPWRHLRYLEKGEILGVSEQGRETIRTCALDRESLREDRERFIDDVLRQLRLLRRLEKEIEELERVGAVDEIGIIEKEISDLWDTIGRWQEDAAPFAGVIRSVIYHEMPPAQLN